MKTYYWIGFCEPCNTWFWEQTKRNVSTVERCHCGRKLEFLRVNCKRYFRFLRAIGETDLSNPRKIRKHSVNTRR